MDKILSGGRIRANAKASKTNMLRVPTPESFKAEAGQDIVTETTSGNLTAFIFDGVTVTLPTAIAVTDTDAIKEALRAHIEENGVKEEDYPIINVTYAGGDLTVEHIGQLVLSSITLSDAGATALARKDTAVPTGVYEIETVGVSGPISYNGSSSALDNDPYAFSGTPATDNATLAALITDLTAELTALSVPFIAGTVKGEKDIANQLYRVQFEAKPLAGPVRGAAGNFALVKSGVIFE